MHLTDIEEKNGKQFEVGMVKMTFRKTSDITSEELSRIYTGDEFFMFLKYTGSEKNNYKVMPHICIAVKGYNVDVSTISGSRTANVQLWNHDKCRSTTAKKQEIMDKFEFIDNYARVKMYGFHFSGSNFISIVCHVHVCHNSSTKDTCSTPTSTNSSSDCFTTTSKIAKTPKPGPKTTSKPGPNPTPKPQIQRRNRIKFPIDGNKKRNFETMDQKLHFDKQQQFNADHNSFMQHIHVRQERSAESTIKKAVVYKTIKVIDVESSGSGASLMNPLVITTFLSFILMKLLI